MARKKKLLVKPKKIFRRAKAMASDVHIYNKEKIEQAIRDDNFFEIIEEEFLEGQKQLEEGVDPEALAKDNYLERAFVDVVLKFSSNVESKIW